MNKYKIETVICAECDGEIDIGASVAQIGPDLYWSGPFPNPPSYGPLHYPKCADKALERMNREEEKNAKAV